MWMRLFLLMLSFSAFAVETTLNVDTAQPKALLTYQTYDQGAAYDYRVNVKTSGMRATVTVADACVIQYATNSTALPWAVFYSTSVNTNTGSFLVPVGPLVGPLGDGVYQVYLYNTNTPSRKYGLGGGSFRIDETTGYGSPTGAYYTIPLNTDLVEQTGTNVFARMSDVSSSGAVVTNIPPLDYTIITNPPWATQAAVAVLETNAVTRAGTNGWEVGSHAGLEPLLPETPTNPSTMYLDGNRTWAPIRVGAGGYAGNLYFRTDTSTNAGYSRLDYMAETASSNLVATISDGEFLLRSYVFDSPIGTSSIDAGMWVASFYAAVSKTTGTSQLKFEAFILETNGTETVLFSSYSGDINNDVPVFLKKESTQPSFAVSPSGRLGAKIYASATASSVTFTTVVGDGNGSFFTTPLRIRHTQLRDFDGDPLYQHVTAAERALVGTIPSLVSTGTLTTTLGGYATTGALSAAVAPLADTNDLNAAIAAIPEPYTVRDTTDTNRWWRFEGTQAVQYAFGAAVTNYTVTLSADFLETVNNTRPAWTNYVWPFTDRDWSGTGLTPMNPLTLYGPNAIWESVPLVSFPIVLPSSLNAQGAAMVYQHIYYPTNATGNVLGPIPTNIVTDANLAAWWLANEWTKLDVEEFERHVDDELTADPHIQYLLETNAVTAEMVTNIAYTVNEVTTIRYAVSNVSDIASYLVLTNAPSTNAVKTIVVSNPTNGQYVAQFVAEPFGVAGSISEGHIETRVHMSISGGGTLSVVAEPYLLDGAGTTITEWEGGNIISVPGIDGDGDLFITPVNTAYTYAATDRRAVKIKVVAKTGAPVLTIYMENGKQLTLTFPVPSSFFASKLDLMGYLPITYTNAIPVAGNTLLVTDGTNLTVTGTTYAYRAFPTNAYQLGISPTAYPCYYGGTIISTNAVTFSTNLLLRGTATVSGTNSFALQPWSNGVWEVLWGAK